MSLWRSRQLHRKQPSDDTILTSLTSGSTSFRSNNKILLCLVCILLLFAVGTQLKLFQTSSLYLYHDDSLNGGNDENRHHHHWLSSFVTPPSASISSHADVKRLSLPVPSSVLTNETWKQWEDKFQANNSILFEQLQQSSVYGSVLDADADADAICDKGYLRDHVRDYIQATTTLSSTTDSVTASTNCNWPQRLQQLKYPWNRSQFPFSDDACPLVHFSSTQACQLLQQHNNQEQHPIVLLFLGDSLIRQIVVGLGMVLTGNIRGGGLHYIHPFPQEDFGPVWKRACSCENQFLCGSLKQEEAGRFTHAFGYDNEHDETSSFQNHVDWCHQDSHSHPADGLRRPPTYKIILEQQNNNPKISPRVQHLITSHANDHQFVIVTDASALHSGLNFRKTRRFLNKLDSLLQLQLLLASHPKEVQDVDAVSASVSARSPLIIPMTVHFVGPNKPKEFLIQQGRQPVEDYNQQLRKWAEQKNYPILDTYSMTEGMPSSDGTHYLTASVALAQILLLYIRDYLPARDGAIMPP